MNLENRGFAPKPDEYLRTKLAQGDVVPFIGAGISMGAKLPNGERMPSYRQLLENLLNGLEPYLGNTDLTKIKSLIEKGELMQAADLIENVSSTGEFYSELRKLLNHLQPKPSIVHEILNLYDFETIITSNYDRLLETTLYPTPEVLTYMDTTSIAVLSMDNKPFVFKIHGDLTRPETVVLGWRRYQELHQKSMKNDLTQTNRKNARNQSFDAEKSLERFINGVLTQKTLLFLGCSFADNEYSEYFSNYVDDLGTTGRHFALIPKGSLTENRKNEWLKKMGVRFIEFVPDKEYSQIWEYLASLKPLHKNHSPIPGNPYENFYLIHERPIYLNEQLKAEKKSLSCRYITPAITNCIATEQHIHLYCQTKLARFKSELGENFEKFKNETSKNMLARAKNIEEKLTNPDFEFRAVFLMSKVKEELATASNVVLDRYKYVLDLFDKYPNQLQLRAYNGDINEEDYMKSTYALVFFGEMSSDIGYFYASQANTNNFTTQMMQVNTRPVTEKVEHFEKFWVASFSVRKTIEILKTEIEKYK